MLRLNSFGSRVLCGLVVISGAGLVTPGARAQVAGPAVLTDEQGHKYLTPYVDPAMTATDSKEKVRIETQKKINNAQSQIRAILGGAPLDGNKPAQFDYYYLRMLFPKFTLTTDEALKDLPKERERLSARQPGSVRRPSDPPAARQFGAEPDEEHRAGQISSGLPIQRDARDQRLEQRRGGAHRRRQEDAGTADRRLAVYSRTVHAGRTTTRFGSPPCSVWFGTWSGITSADL